MNILIRVLYLDGREEELRIWFEDYKDQNQFEKYSKKVQDMIRYKGFLPTGEKQKTLINMNNVSRIHIF